MKDSFWQQKEEGRKGKRGRKGNRGDFNDYCQNGAGTGRYTPVNGVTSLIISGSRREGRGGRQRESTEIFQNLSNHKKSKEQRRKVFEIVSVKSQ